MGMAFLRIIIRVMAISSVGCIAFAAGPEPLEFLTKALGDKGISFTEAQIVTSYDPFVHAVNIMGYLDRAATLVDKDRMAWAFYRFQYRDKDGVLKDCTAGIAFKRGLTEHTRIVDINACDGKRYSPNAKSEVYGVVSLSSENISNSPATKRGSSIR
jgi:hypothetical protein